MRATTRSRQRTPNERTWTWSEWEKLLAESPYLNDDDRRLGRALRALGTRRPVQAWLLGESNAAFYRLRLVGLVHRRPTETAYAAVYDPLPAENSILVSTKAASLLRRMLHEGLLLWRTTAGDTGWELRRGALGTRKLAVHEAAADELLAVRLIEWDGVGDFPVYRRMRYTVARRRLVGVRGFRAGALNWLEAQTEAR